jgi:TolB protein
MSSISTAMFVAAITGADYITLIRSRSHRSRLAKRLVQSRVSRSLPAAILFLTFILVACNQDEQTTKLAPEETSPALDEPTAVSSPTTIPEPAATPPPLSILAGVDGGVIAFYSMRDGNAEIYTINTDGTNERRLTINRAADKTPSWSPNGELIAFVSTGNGNEEIYIMNADGSDQRQLTDHDARDLHPDWSFDGTQIVFVSDRDGDMEIYVMDSDGANQRRLTHASAGDMRPDWSPDGRQILFNSERDGNWEIYVMDADGENQRRLTESPDWELFPAWSPDGMRIVYFSMIGGVQKQDIYVMNADGTSVRQLTNNPNSVDEDPVWSPDGNQIAFQSDRDGNYEIYLMDADGSSQRPLTNNSAGEYWPAWRPSFLSQETPVPTSSIYAPQGIPPTIDGVFSPSEWDNALAIDLANGELLLMHAGDYLYLGIRSDNLGLGSVCVRWDDEISILHSSAALGTATYVKAGEEWLKTRDFSWTNRDISNGQQALDERREHLEREDWLASNGLMGNSNEMEYQIAMTDDAIRLGVTYLMSPDYQTTDFWPDTLGAGCRNFEPLPGDPPETVNFAPETWITVNASNE